MTRKATHTFHHKLRTLAAPAFFILASFFLSSCDLVYDDDCACETADAEPIAEVQARYYVSLRYDMNMEWADAFQHYVHTVTLAAFDSTGLCTYTKTALADTLDDQTLDISDINPGTYTLVVWALGEEVTADCYTLPTPTPGLTTLDDMDALVDRSENLTIDHDLTLLFHAMEADCDLQTLDEQGECTVDLDLTRNTNVVRIVLQNLSGEDLSEDDFLITLTDNNGHLAHDNSRLDDDIQLTYQPWSTYSGTAGVETNDTTSTEAPTRTTTQVSAVIAELTTNRLFDDSDARLTVRNSDTGETVLSIPLVDYALLIKGNYNSSLTDQEYLDRQSEYNFTFFLDEGGNWYAAYIYINSWRVVLIDTDL